MSATQYLRLILAHKWLVVIISILATVAGGTYAIRQPRTYTADALLVLDVRPDPLMGGFVSAASMATQIELLKSDKVAALVVNKLGLDKSPASIQQWQKSTAGKIPLDRFFANALQRGLAVEAVRGSNIIDITFTAQDASFAAAAANAFAQAAVDVSVELRVEPAKQSAGWFDGQTKVLRSNLEQAQERLSKYQQENGIVVSDEKVDQENARLNALETQLVTAQSERAEASGRQRNSGSEMSPDVQQSALVQGLKSQLAAAQTKLLEVSSVLGTNHPQRVLLETQIASLKEQLATEVRRVSGGAMMVSRASVQKAEELRGLVDAQKARVLSLRSQRDQIALLVRDVETAQRAYEGASQRAGQLSLESQSNQTNVRMLSPAVEALYPSQRKVMLGIIGSFMGGFLLSAALAIGLELRDRRVRHADDLSVVAGINVIGVLRPTGSTRPIFRRLAGISVPSGNRLPPAAGMS